MLMYDNVAIVILAAGLGTRMKSERAKVLHEILGRPMVTYVMETASEIVGNRVVVVVGHQAEQVEQIVSQRFDATFAFQERQLGTGHAVGCALPHLPSGTREVLILYGDVPLLKAATVKRFIENHIDAKRQLSILCVEMDDPTGYGRMILDADGGVREIVEEADADADQKHIRLINTGIYCVQADFLNLALRQLSADNVQGELYLTDIVGIGYRMGKTIGMVRQNDSDEVSGINTGAELAAAERIMGRRLCFKS